MIVNYFLPLDLHSPAVRLGCLQLAGELESLAGRKLLSLYQIANLTTIRVDESRVCAACANCANCWSCSAGVQQATAERTPAVVLSAALQRLDILRALNTVRLRAYNVTYQEERTLLQVLHMDSLLFIWLHQLA
jgi:hypothetical protein